jgi:biopolymer transport protein ExbB
MNYEHLHDFNYERFHHLAFAALYVCAAVAVFVIIERGLYFAYLSLRSGRIARLLERAVPAPGAHPLDALSGKDPISAAIGRYAQLQSRAGVTRGEAEDYSSALFIEVDKKISARLWMLDTIVTAAPLLGLLGTILGIMETFTALAQGGVSDPGEVSRGIGTALIATAIGIATALLGLFGNNVLNRYATALIEDFKSYVLRIPATSRAE